MSTAFRETLRVEAVPGAMRFEAFRWLWPDLATPNLQQLIESYEQLSTGLGPNYWQGLLGGFRGQELRGVVWLEPQAGGVAAIHGPKVALHEPASTGQELLAHAIAHGNASRLRLLQSLISPQESVATLEDAGFRHAAELLFMHANPGVAPMIRPATELQFDAYSPAIHGRFVNMVEQTYHGSLDCPAADGLRSVEEVLQGYQQTGNFHPSRWLLASAPLAPQSPAVDVGCLLLTDQPATAQWELMYMGLIPAARGRGWGDQLVRQALSMAHVAGVESLVLAVDAANEPSVRMYQGAGFSTFDRRQLYLRALAAGI